jgi:hypothetical protein
MDTQGTRSIGSPWFLCRGQPFEAQDSLNDAGGGIALPSQKDTSQTVYHPRASGLLRGGRALSAAGLPSGPAGRRQTYRTHDAVVKGRPFLRNPPL